MIKIPRSTVSSNILLLTIVFLIFIYISVLFNIPVLRQFSGFIFLTFVPGFLILAILKLDKLGLVEKIVLSVGLSVSFIMLYGLLVNFVSLTLGYAKPLSTFPMLASFGIAAIVLAYFAYKRNKDISLSIPHPGLTIKEKLLLIMPSLFPLLSIIGMRVMNTTGNNILLMFLLFLIPAYLIFIAVYQSKIPKRLYPAFIYLTGISLLLLLPLRGNHLLGSDTHESYYFFQATLQNQYWSVITSSLVDSLLSISLLPSIYQIFLRMPQEYLFQLLYPLLFSISPLVIYVIARKYAGSFYAFLASFLFMSQFYFIWATAASQTIISIGFFALAIMVWFHDDLNEFARRLFFLLFALSAVVSHYSTSFIFFAVILLTGAGAQIIHRVHLKWKGRATSTQDRTTAIELNDSLSSEEHVTRAIHVPTYVTDKVTSPFVHKGISMTIILLFFVVIFLWHAQITNYAFDSAVNLIFRTLSSMNKSLLLESKGPEVIGSIGQYGLSTIPQQIRIIFSWLTVIFIALGGLSIAFRYKSAVAYDDSNNVKPIFLESKFELEYFVISGVCGIVLACAVILPYITQVYSMERVYLQMLAALSVYFVICGTTIARWLKIKPYLILLPILIPFFMSVTGTTYQLFNIPASLVLNSTGTEYELFYISDEESSAAKWLSQNTGRGDTIYVDYGLGPRILASQGGILSSRVRVVADEYRQGRNINGFIYLFYPSVIKGEATLSKYVKMDITPLPELLATRNALYTNGAVEIYR